MCVLENIEIEDSSYSFPPVQRKSKHRHRLKSLTNEMNEKQDLDCIQSVENSDMHDTEVDDVLVELQASTDDLEKIERIQSKAIKVPRVRNKASQRLLKVVGVCMHIFKCRRVNVSDCTRIFGGMYCSLYYTIFFKLLGLRNSLQTF